MTKRIIDADALLEQIQIEKNNCPFNDINSKRGWGVTLLNIEQHISLLATPAPEPQESIFDADGWCWDMSLLKIGESALLFNNREGFSVGFRDTVGVYADADMINLTEEYQKSERLNKRIQGYVIEWQAWRPLPTIPQGGVNVHNS